MSSFWQLRVHSFLFIINFGLFPEKQVSLQFSVKDIISLNVSNLVISAQKINWLGTLVKTS